MKSRFFPIPPPHRPPEPPYKRFHRLEYLHPREYREIRESFWVCIVPTRPGFPAGLQCHSFVAFRPFLHDQVLVPKKRHIWFGLLNLSLAFRPRHYSLR